MNTFMQDLSFEESSAFGCYAVLLGKYIVTQKVGTFEMRSGSTVEQGP
jgi:hypothetical protein